LHRAKRKNFVIDRIADGLEVSRSELAAAIDALESRGEIVRTGKGRIALAERMGLVAGRVRGGYGGKAIVIAEDRGPPIALARGGVRPAMHGDRVLVEVAPYSRRGLRTGVVKRVLERAVKTLVGELLPSAGGTILMPRDARHGIVARVVDPPEVAPGTLVSAEIVEYPTSYRDPLVRVTETLGKGGSLPAEIEGVCRSMGIPLLFDDAVMAAAEEAAKHEDPSGFVRTDLRGLLTVTIDPEDAKDHDDAVAIEPLGDGFRLTVSIADVAHFVRPGSLLDCEAMERGNSVYFPGRCVPMLPEQLSGDVASLKAEVDRRTLSVVLEIDEDGNVAGERFCVSWIRSRRVFTYEEVQAILDSQQPADAQIAESLQRMARCALALNRRRVARGALDLDIPESEIHVDTNGEPQTVRRRPRLLAHRVIEEFMLAANEAVARRLERAHAPFLYRIHEAPDDRGLGDLVTRLAVFGLRLPHDGTRLRSADLRAIIDKIRGKPAERVVNILVLRSMQQARYSAYKAIHFGLASDCYTHFTSPIRRYPDLLAHRALRACIASDHVTLGSAAALEPAAALSSQRERRAMEAEREVARIAGILLMKPHLGETFNGTVTGVDRVGYWVELDEFFVEGFVPVGRLPEYYQFVSERVELQSRTSSRAIRLGDRARVVVVAADIGERRLDFAPVETA
jgi:ribonuclease R